MSIQVPEATLAEIREALFRGQKIDAIKLYREYTETGLAEAKTTVEELEVELRSTSPDKFSAAPPGEGCCDMAAIIPVRGIAVIVMFLLIVAAVVWWLVRK